MENNKQLENEGEGEDLDCLRPRILSKETTEEILGDNLSSIVAIGKDGKPYLFLPYGTDETAFGCDLCDEEAMALLDISIKVPKNKDVG
jgi:hypothetical protein